MPISRAPLAESHRIVLQQDGSKHSGTNIVRELDFRYNKAGGLEAVLLHEEAAQALAEDLGGLSLRTRGFWTFRGISAATCNRKRPKR